MLTIFLFMLLMMAVVVVLAAIGNHWNRKRDAAKKALMSPQERETYDQAKKQQAALSRARAEESARDVRLTGVYGNKSPQMLCPHCQVRGSVRTRSVLRKKGVSGGKATAAVLTLGWSTLAVGLSRKEQETQAHCDNCDNNWHF